MARSIGRLSAISVPRKRAAGRYPDGGGLYLQISSGGARSWVFRFMLRGRAREMGLGSLNDVSLAEARKRASDCRLQKSAGADPIENRLSVRKEVELELARALTFEQCAEAYVAAHTPSWRNAKHAAQWTSTLKTYAYPIFGVLSVQAVDTPLVMKVLEPIWASKPTTAARLRGRIECVLDWAKAKGNRTGENPARWRGHIENMLPRPSKLRQVRHHSALPYVDIGKFMEALHDEEGTAARALELLILTATRTSETINARWQEFDLTQGIWEIPAERMKAGRSHRVALSAPAIKLLKKRPRDERSEFVFPGAKRAKPLSNMAMLALLKRMGYARITAHGFRSTFRDWVAEQTSHQGDVAEMALAHAINNKVEAAYRRGDMFEKRRRLMADWASYIDPTRSEKVVPIRKAKSAIATA